MLIDRFIIFMDGGFVYPEVLDDLMIIRIKNTFTTGEEAYLSNKFSDKLYC